MNKRKLFLDFDGTIVHSVKAYCTTYNGLYKDKKDFVTADYRKVRQWDLKDQCHLVHHQEEIFSSAHFFSNLEFMPGALEIIQGLHEKFEIIICTIGTFDNIAYKSQWIKERMPFINNAIFLTNEGIKMDKSAVDMAQSIFIDDHASNLYSSNASLKICFGGMFPWNEGWQRHWCFNWQEVKNLLENEVEVR